MKKLLSLALVAVMAVTAFCIPAYAYTGHADAGDKLKFGGATDKNVFGDLLDWTGVVFENTNNIIDLEGTLAVGGDFISNTGFSVNSGAYGTNPADTDDVAFLVNNNVKIAGYGNVYGQTVVGNADGNTYKLTNVTPAETTNGKYTVADTAKYFADAKSTAEAAKAAVEALQANGEVEAVAGGTYTFKGSDADTIVYNVDDADFNGYLFDFTIDDGQTVIVNFTAAQALKFKNGAVRINGNMEPDYLRKFNRNIIINVANATKIEMTSCELYGILLAPQADLDGKGANVCGTAILNNLTGERGFELHVGYNNKFVPEIAANAAADETPTEAPTEAPAAADDDKDTVEIRIDAPLKMAVAFADGTICYGGEMKTFEVGKEYKFRMCAVNWGNGIYDGNENGLAGTVVYTMKLVHNKEFKEIAAAAQQNPDRYTVKGMDVIDNEEKTIIVNCDAKDAHLETDVNNFFMAYRFHFTNGDYKKLTGIDKVINTPVESLSVNLPLGSTVTCNAYAGGERIDTADVFIANNNGEGIYDNVYLTSVNDYYWNH